MAIPTPILDPRLAADLVNAETALAPAYVPELLVTPGAAGSALLQILGRYGQAVIERLNQAPDKNKLAFLDRMGISLLPPQASRAPVVFKPIANIGDGSVPAQTRVGAQGTDPNNPIVFQTGREIALASANLVEVRAVYPAADSWADYSAAATAGNPFTLFRSLTPIGHHIYLAHNTLLWLAGSSTVTIQFKLHDNGGVPLAIEWSFWNGEIWQPLAVADGTNGLMASGSVTLTMVSGEAAQHEVNGVTAYWIRGITTSPLAPLPGPVIATANQIQLQSVISRPLATGIDALQPDSAVSGGSNLDLTKPVYPLGRTPDAGSALYFTSGEVFSKPGANAQLYLEHKLTPEEQADLLAEAQLEAQGLSLESQVAQQAAQSGTHAADSLLHLLLDDGAAASVTANLVSAIDAADNASKAAITLAGMQALPAQLTNLSNSIAALDATFPNKLGFSNKAQSQLADSADQLAAMLSTLSNMANVIAPQNAPMVLNIAAQAVNAVGQIAVFVSADSGKLAAFDSAADAVAQVSDLSTLSQPVSDLTASIRTSMPTSVDYHTAVLLFETIQTSALSMLGFVIALAETPGNGTTDTHLPKLPSPRLVWEYWNGDAWDTLIAPSSNAVANFLATGTVSFTVPSDFAPSAVGNTTARWVRVRIASGSFNSLRFVTWKDQVTNTVTSMALLQPRPPMLAGFYLGYDYNSPTKPAENLFTLNDAAWADVTEAASSGGPPFEMLRPTSDRTPTLYLGFDKALPEDVVSLFLNMQVNRNTTQGPAIDWQYWDGGEWQDLNAQDDTQGLALPGIVSVAWPGAASVPLARFGKPYTWLRGALENDAAPPRGRVLGVFPNAVWADNLQTVQNETLGSSDGSPDQSFFFKQTPVLGAATLQICELNGARAATELSAFTAGLLAAGYSSSAIRVVNDVKTGSPTQVWVTWNLRPNLLLSSPDARDYTIERDTGRVIFGDNEQGMIPPPGQDNILALSYNFGGGTVGNVAAGAINQLMSGVTAQSVTNPIPGEGGAAGETLAGVLARGPRVMRHRYRAISCADYEDLAREASPGIAAARALPCRQANGRIAPGWVTVIIVPLSADPQPQPSFELCEQVQAYLARHAPASLAGLDVIGPQYLPVGVNLSFAPTSIQSAAPAANGLAAALNAFLQPLTGGPSGAGWPFGRGVYSSDLAGLVESVAGVDYVSSLALVVNGTPVGDFAPVPNNQIVAAGPLGITVVAIGD